jgi:hypothetical protein
MTMRINWGLPVAVAALGLAGAVATGCQTYDFEEVVPRAVGVETQSREVKATVSPPNLMILLDKSDSMDRPENPSLAACKTGPNPEDICGVIGNPPCDEVSCPTRLSRLQEAIDAFLAARPDGTYPFRVGLAAYPIQGQCSPTPRTFVDFPEGDDRTVLATKAGEVNAVIQGIQARTGAENDFQDDETAGGTPTAESLRFLYSSVEELRDTSGGRKSFVLLLTDGLPNCNENHPVTPETCQCVLADPSLCFTGSGIPTGCLDDVNSISAVTELAAVNVSTIVVGMGAETGEGLGPDTLDAMGEAGGFVRRCMTDADCGSGDSCDRTGVPADEAGVCERKFFQAADGAALAAALTRIAEEIEGNPCELEFETAPASNELIFVKVNDQIVLEEENGTVNWTFDPNASPKPTLTFQGAICELIESSDEANPVPVKVSLVQAP